MTIVTNVALNNITFMWGVTTAFDLFTFLRAQLLPACVYLPMTVPMTGKLKSISLFVSDWFQFSTLVDFVSPANCHQPESRAVGHPCNPLKSESLAHCQRELLRQTSVLHTRATKHILKP